MTENLEDIYPNISEISDVKPSSLVSIEVGTINTRASLFDMVEGRYRFLAAGTAPTTINPPFSDISEGVRLAIANLTAISGRSITNINDDLIIPSDPDGYGVDHLAASYSVGNPLKTIVIGLLDKVSLESAVHLAHTVYTDIIDTISISEHGQSNKQINTIVHSRPDLVILAGGTNGGASKTVLKMVNALRMAIYLIPEGFRPTILFVGNEELAEKVQNLFSPITEIHTAPNIRPSLSKEQLDVAQSKLSELFQTFHNKRTLGFQDLNDYSGGFMVPASKSFGRVIRFFSKIVRTPDQRGVLGIDLGSDSTTVAAAFNGDLRLRVVSKLGIGTGLESILKSSQLKDITRWLSKEIPPSEVLDYIQNKIIRPGTLPVTDEDLEIEQALAREIIQQALKKANMNFPKNIRRVEKGTLPNFDPILVSGSTLGLAPSAAQSLLMILDALQPMGIQQIILDKNSLAIALGAAIPINPTLVSQLLLDPIAFLNLGFVVSPAGKAKLGSPVLKVRIDYESGHSNIVTVDQGEIQKIPLALGQRARIYLDPLQRTNLGSGPGKRLPPHAVVGGPFGLIIDARGRPIKLPNNSKKRRALLRKWAESLEKKD